MELLKEAGSACGTEITLFDKPVGIPVDKEIKQSNTVSLKLFIAVLKSVTGKMNWNSDVNASDEVLSQVHSTDDIALLAKHGMSLEGMLNQLKKKFFKDRLKINKSKAKRTRTEATTERKLRIAGEKLEEDSHICPGQEIDRGHEISGELPKKEERRTRRI